MDIFISYTHESPLHKSRARRLAQRLRSDGFTPIIDAEQTQTPRLGWPLWSAQQIRDADVVLVVSTREYYERTMNTDARAAGLGARWEGHLILDALYNSGLTANKYVPVIFDPRDSMYIPDPLRSRAHYELEREYPKLVTDFRTLVDSRHQLSHQSMPEMPAEISNDEAVAIAEAIAPTAGIIRALPFRSVPLRRDYIAVLRQKVYGTWQRQVILLERFGETWRRIWRLDPTSMYFDEASFAVEDIDNDGTPEVIVREWEEAQISESQQLNVYSPARRRHFYMLASRRLSGTMYQATPEITVSPDDDFTMVAAIESYAQRLNLLAFAPLAADDPRRLLTPWLARRAQAPGGDFELEFFPGRPSYMKASLACEQDVGEITYIAFFKGPLYCYHRQREAYFIAFVTNSQYDWVRCFAIVGRQFWFGIGDSTLFVHEFDGARESLRHAVLGGDEHFQGIHEMQPNGLDELVVNGSIVVRLTELHLTLGLPARYSEFDDLL